MKFYSSNNSAFSNRVNIPYNVTKTSANSFLIEVALAGYDKNNILVEVSNSLLHIRTSTQESKKLFDSDLVTEIIDPVTFEKVPRDKVYPISLHKGISNKSFSMSFELPQHYSSTSATFKDGILQVTVLTEDKKEKSTFITIE